jgi:DNA repair/transcription protein MET18/MMS19
MKPKFPSTDARLIAQAIFSFNIERNLRDQKAATRRALLELLDTLIQLYKPSLIINGSSKAFVEGVVLMGEFEKDPTCLGILLPMYEKLSKEWELSEDALLLIWDSFVRYYPITISGQNASVPTPDDLRRFLLNCFISNDTYAKNAFPRLIELLDTSQDLSANVKVRIFHLQYYIYSHK